MAPEPLAAYCSPLNAPSNLPITRMRACMWPCTLQDDSNFYGQSLHLIKVTQLDTESYMEAYVRTVEPSGDGNWYSSRTHHVDLQQVRRRQAGSCQAAAYRGAGSWVVASQHTAAQPQPMQWRLAHIWLISKGVGDALLGQ